MPLVTLRHPGDAIGVDPISFYRAIRARLNLQMGEAKALLDELTTNKQLTVQVLDRDTADALVQEMTALRVRCTLDA